jgi:O-antigen/teichoic acid export membrane protein
LNERVSRGQVGLYSLAVTLAELTYLATDSVSQALLPRQVEPNLEQAGRFTARLARTNMIVAVLIIGVTSVAAPVALTSVYGEAYRGTISALVVLGPGIVMLCVARTLLPYLVRLERPWAVSALTVSALALNVALNLLLIPRMGIVGSSLASSIAYAVLTALAIAWWCRSARLGLRELIPRLSDVREPLERLRTIRG